MTRELQKRIVTTAALLLVARALAFIPIPSINFAVFRQFATDASSLSDASSSGFMQRFTIGAVGIGPYLPSSCFIILFYYFRKFREDFDDHDLPIELYTLILTGIIALLQGYGIALFLESMSTPEGGSVIAANSGWSFRLLTMLSCAAGTYFLVWLARQITQKGIGNGICLLIVSNIIASTGDSLVDLIKKIGSQGPDALMQLIVFGLGALALIVIVILLTLANWHVPCQRASSARDLTQSISLRINGVGVTGLGIASSIAFGVSLTLMLFSDGSIAKVFSDPTNPYYWVTPGILAFVATYFFTAWAYNPRGLHKTLDKFDITLAKPSAFVLDSQFDRKLAIVTLPLALVVPMLCFFISWLSTIKYYLTGLSALNLFVITAILLDTYRQFQFHRQIGDVEDEINGEFICDNCHRIVAEEDGFCHTCGLIFGNELTCEQHPQTKAVAYCVICGKRLCQECSFLFNNHYTCEEHSDIEIIENWATVSTTRTRLEAELLTQRLKEFGLSALVHSNTIEPAYGTLGLFEINPVTPFFVYRELGGGQIRVMVPAREWMDALKRIA